MLAISRIHSVIIGDAGKVMRQLFIMHPVTKQRDMGVAAW